MREQVQKVDGEVRFTVPPACYYFDLNPLRERCDSLRRYPERLSVICETQVRNVAPGDLYLPRESGFYFVVQTRAGIAADALASEINTSLIRHFFGTDSLDGLDVLFRIAQMSELPATAIATLSHLAQERSPTSLRMPPARRQSDRNWLERNSLELGTIPIFNLQTSRICMRLVGAVRKAGGETIFGSAAAVALETRERMELDKILLAQGHAMSELKLDGVPVGACVPVSYETLSWSRSRAEYQSMLKSLALVNNPYFVLRIEDVPPGITASRIIDITAAVRPFVRRTVMHLPEINQRWLGGKLGLSGVSASISSTQGHETNLTMISALASFARQQGIAACIQDFASAQMIRTLTAAGIRLGIPVATPRNIAISGKSMPADQAA